jgi:hypothetical protein
LITIFNTEKGKLERVVRTGLPGDMPADPSEGLENSLCEVVFKTERSLVKDNMVSPPLFLLAGQCDLVLLLFQNLQFLVLPFLSETHLLLLKPI